jgi:PAS domain S-box-containing protein
VKKNAAKRPAGIRVGKVPSRATTLPDAMAMELPSKTAERPANRPHSKLEVHDQARLFNLSFEPIFVWSAEDGIVEWNRGAEKLYGYTKEEAIGCNVHELLKTVHALPPASRLANLTEGGRWTAELQQTTRDGMEVVVESRQQLIEIDGRRLVVETNRDITAQVRARQLLRYQLDLTQAITDNAQSGLFMTDLEGRITFANQAAERITGFNREELIGKIWHEMVHHTHPDGSPFRVEECSFTQALLSQETIVADEDVFVGKDGRYYPVRRSARPILKDGIAAGMIVEILDITEEKRIEAERQEILRREKAARREAEHANRAKDEFLAVLSHELRTPLHSIKGWITILQNGAVDDETKNRGLEVIARNVNSQNALIEDILDVSRIVLGKLSLEVKRISLASIVRNVADEARLDAEAAGIELHAVIDDSADQTDGDPLRLRQIINNLLTNAIKFSPRGGRVDVKLERIGDLSRLTVRDTGIGIEPGILPRIFDRFRQADSTSRRSHSGLGLGLAIAKHLTELHGGSISAMSEGVGKGATFAIELPIANGAAPSELSGIDAGAEGKRRWAAGSLEGLKLLVVDDDEDALQILRLGLGNRGATVECVHTAQSALERLRESEFDLLISDIGMAEMDGYDLIREVRRTIDKPGAVLPAIALSGYVSLEDRDRSLASGFQMHLSKPIDLSSLPFKIRKLLDRGPEFAV